MDFDAESLALYDAVAPVLPEAEFAECSLNLKLCFPAKAPVQDRYEHFREDFTITPERLDRVFRAAIDESRRRSARWILLPEEETFTLEYVTKKSWSGYNWYRGSCASLIQINTDLPIAIDRAVDLASHEGYPGHHVYNCLLEDRLVRARGWVEFSVYALFSPQSLIAEGTANFGIAMAFPGPERVAFEQEVLFPLAGLDSARAEALLPRPRDGSATELCGQRSCPGISERHLDGHGSRRVARPLCAHEPGPGTAANPLLRPVPELCDQLQPGPGSGEGTTWRVKAELPATRDSAGRFLPIFWGHHACRRTSGEGRQIFIPSRARQDSPRAPESGLRLHHR